MLGLIIIALTFLANPPVGIIIATIIIYDYNRKKKSAIKMVEKDLWPKICPRPGTTPDEILMYRGCTVEIYRNPFNVTRIIKPNGKDLGASFRNVADAISSIDSHVD